jgi:hypothetical protein
MNLKGSQSEIIKRIGGKPGTFQELRRAVGIPHPHQPSPQGSREGKRWGGSTLSHPH